MAQVSVLTASYGHGAYVSEAVESVLQQSHNDFYYLICDDGSPDDSWQIIQRMAKADGRIRTFRHEGGANLGLAATLCLLLEKVETEWVAFLESDDVWKPDFLAQMLNVAEENPEAKLLYCNIEPFGQNLSYQQKMLASRRRYALRKSKERADLLFHYPVTTFSSVLVKTETLKNCNWHVPIANALDKYLWAQCLRNNAAVYVDKVLCRWRKHGASYSDTAPGSDIANTWDMLFDVLYPGGNAADKAKMRKFMHGRLEKIFREQFRYATRLCLKSKYGKHMVNLKSHTVLPQEKT